MALILGVAKYVLGGYTGTTREGHILYILASAKPSPRWVGWTGRKNVNLTKMSMINVRKLKYPLTTTLSNIFFSSITPI